jgi:Acetyltransferase (GNAT) family
MKFDLSNIDNLRFGVITGKAKIQKGDSIDALMRTAHSRRVELLIVRLPTDEIELCQQLELAGGLLTDTLTYFEKNAIEEYQIALQDGYMHTTADAKDADQLEQVAALSFNGYFGHYHADPYLSRVDCDAVYSSWARNSCLQRTVADEVILIMHQTKIAAFATLKKIDHNDFEGILFGVAPSHQEKGLHCNLIKLSENWGVKNGFKRFFSSTQINNVTVQKNWCRVGMVPFESFYTFHLWINK